MAPSWKELRCEGTQIKNSGKNLYFFNRTKVYNLVERLLDLNHRLRLSFETYNENAVFVVSAKELYLFARKEFEWTTLEAKWDAFVYIFTFDYVVSPVVAKADYKGAF